MSESTISALPPAYSANLEDLLAGDQTDGFTRRISVKQVLALAPTPAVLAVPSPGFVFSDGTALQQGSVSGGLAYSNGTLTGLSLPQSSPLLGSDSNGQPMSIAIGLGLVEQNGQLLAESEIGYMLAYFSNGTSSLLVPANTLTHLPLSAVVDGYQCFNSSTGLYTTPIGAGFCVSGEVRLGETGASGMPPAGTSVGLTVNSQILAGTNMHYSPTGSTSSSISFSQQMGVAAGSTFGFFIYCPQAITVVDARFAVQIVA